ncbi:type I-F CRISPR-associated endoribonuclease Cas6/Csy4 [Shewanella sp. NKUCC01_JLK]|uniref:type I-F CRISPR-associated endoribonuclease Cas6/Csy4 n=1 Tax=Shewanella sp. NKUCC01_JLK TaxID=2842123 RepID=UPI001C5A8973|nr:type I-F CRISPR-associated endoribonuclease Cas6/Csy4 [Shewanella sp. NKUCC01_JLK]MBW3516361.1 type I-F CRISPR-associated endoribonuclease Cas6/Csy4 [Shewanella sp. NKUCC01_JLK]
MQRYYFMVRFLPEEANLALLMGRCISVMHGYICKNEIKGLGVTFPAWSDASIGNVIAFVHANEAVLSELKLQSYFQDMKECGFFSLGSVKIVPADCAEVMFKRNPAIAKMFVGEARRRLKRLEKRALARGKAFSPSKNTNPREFITFHRIAMSSGSNKQDYLLHIQKMEAKEQTEPLFSSYGFASNLQLNGTVPELSRLVDKI